MSDLDPETFEEEKYRDYFPQLQTAYRRAFEAVNDRYDSSLVHAIDQQVMSESEPFYEGDGTFRVEVPEDPHERLEDVVAGEERVETVLEAYVEAIEAELADVFVPNA